MVSGRAFSAVNKKINGRDGSEDGAAHWWPRARLVGAPAAIAIIVTRKVMVAMCGFGKERRWEALGRINGRIGARANSQRAQLVRRRHGH